MPRVGCKVCEPDSIVCDGARRSRCAADGSSVSFVEECPAGVSCDELGCLDLCAAAVQNLLLAAHASGLGAVWTGVCPREERIDGFRRLLKLPDHVVPHSLIVLGYPAEEPAADDRFHADRIHRNGW